MIVPAFPETKRLLGGLEGPRRRGTIRLAGWALGYELARLCLSTASTFQRERRFLTK
jgi:hypothetical protein